MPLSLHTLTAKPGSRRQRRRVGRGNGSRGSYSGRGAKGQRSRTGGRRGLIRRSLRSLMERVPKQRGFKAQAEKCAIVSVSNLERTCMANETVTPASLIEKHLIETPGRGIKVLGGSALTKPITVYAHAFSRSAKESIEKAGGKAVLLEGRKRDESANAKRK
ncbi:MAG: 50S ribosomal protein L15 [Candidatus Kerfeldbacteria bacterium]